MIQRPKTTPSGLNEADHKTLVNELTKYAKEGASDEELRKFRETFISLKKKELTVSSGQTEPKASTTRTQPTSTSSDTEPPTRAQASVGLGGPTKLFGQEEQARPKSVMYGDGMEQKDVLVPSQPIDIVKKQSKSIPSVTKQDLINATSKQATDMSGNVLISKKQLAKDIKSLPKEDQKLLIEPKKTYTENLGDNLFAGLNDVNKMITSIPETVYDLFSIPQNAIAYATGWDISTNSDKFKKDFGVENPLLNHYKEEGKKLEENISKFNEENYKSSSIYDNIESGNYSDAFELLGSGILRSAPVSVAMMAGGATLTPAELAAASTVGFYGPNQEQLREDNPDASDIENNIKALGMSAAESVFSSVGEGQIGAVYRDIIKREGAEIGEKVFKDGLISMYKGALKKYGVPVGLLGEGIEESATQITQNMISGKPAFQGAADAFIQGGGSGVVFTAPISLNNAKNKINGEIIKIKNRREINNILSDTDTPFNKVFDISKNDEINDKQFKIASLDKSRELLVKDLKNSVRKGDLTQDQAKQSLYVFDKTKQIAGQLKDVNVDDNSKVKIANLLKERDVLSTKIQNQDESLSVLEKQRISEINNEIQKTIIDSKKPIIEETQVTTIDKLPLEEQDRLKREALIQLTQELNPEGKKDITITNEQITQRAFDNYSKEMSVKPAEVKGISPETSSNVANLTQDDEGNYVFYHTSPTTLDVIDPKKYGTNPKNVTSNEEKAAIGRVGGVSMYYPAENVAENIVTGNTHMVKIPESEVYDFNADPLNLIEEARAKFEKEYPNMAFTPNDQFAQVTKLANERGFKMVVGEWKNTTRAQTTEPLTPIDVKERNGDVITKPFQKEYKSNLDKGFKPVIPETKQEKLAKVYDEIYNFKNSQNKYDSLYHLKEDYAKMSQEEITKMIEESDLPQELKDKYAEAVAYEPEQRRTEIPKYERTDDVVIENAPEGSYLNIGLNIGTTDELLNKDNVISMLPEGVDVLEEEVREVTSEIEGKENKEVTLLVKLSRALTDAEMSKLLIDTQQKAIPQLTEGKGAMHGTKEWGDFNAEYFYIPNKGQLSEYKSKEQAKVELTPEKIGEGLLNVLGIPVEKDVKFSKIPGEPDVLTSKEEKEKQLVDTMNTMELVNNGIDLSSPSTTKEKIDVEELNSRLDTPIEEINWSDYEGIPFGFTISDQLRTGDVKNPYTGETITDLKGGIGFNGTKGNENKAWANTTKEEGVATHKKAIDIYNSNKPLFEKLWKEGKLPNGVIPFGVVKMGEKSIVSNEAVSRAAIQNIETLPKSNRKKAVAALAKSMKDRISSESKSLKKGVDEKGKPYTENTIKLKKKSIKQYQKILDIINKYKYNDIADILKDKDHFSLPERALIMNQILYGKPNEIGAKAVTPGIPNSLVSKTLLQGLDKSKRVLINLGNITDLLTEPSMKNVPNMHIVSIVGVKVAEKINGEWKSAGGVVNTNHPNYKYGVEGESIGVLKQPIHMKDAFSEAYGSALSQVVKNEANKTSISEKGALTQGIPVQSGLPNRVFKSAIAKGNLDAVDKLSGFLRQAFPSVTFFTSQEAWNAAMEEPSIKKKLKDGDVVYAFTTDGNVFINPNLKTTKATLHETGHIWMSFVKENNPDIHKKGLSLVDGTKEYQKAIEEYGDTELAREEALMELMSSKGDTIVNAAQKAKFKEWLLSLYKYISDNFTSLRGLSPKQIENLTLDKFLEGMLADILSGKELTTKKIKGEVKFSLESQDSKIRDYIESQRKAGVSDEIIKAGIESVAERLGLTPEKINDLMGREKFVKDINSIVETEKRKGIEDKDIIENLLSKGYDRKKATNAILEYNKVTAVKLRKEDSVFTKEGRNKIVTFLDQVKRRAFSARSFLPKSVFLQREKIESNIKAEAKRASYLVDDFNRLVKKYKGDVDELNNEFDKYLRGDQTANLPDEFKAVAGKMRMHIDNLSQMLLRTGAVSVSQAETIAANLGKYINRSYQVFDKKNWAKQVKEEMKEAARIDLRNKYRANAESKAKQTGMDADIILEDFINKKIEEIISGESEATFLGVGKTGAKNLGIMKKLNTDIPLSIRQLMGEYTDASQNYARTVLKIATLAENARFLQSAREAGMGVFFYNENDPNRPKEFNTKIAGDKSDTMSPLNGLYTTPEIAKAFTQKVGTGDAIEAALGTEFGPIVKSMYETYMKALSSVKWLKTIGSVATHAKNVTGNIWFMLSNGYYNPKKYAEAFKVLKNSSNEQLRDKLDEYIRAGIIDQSAALGEIKAMFSDADFETAIDSRLKKNPFQKIKAGVKKLGQKMSTAYQLEDDFFKIISYESEKNRYANAYFDKSFDELTNDQKYIVKNYASEITKNILPNYSRIPGLVKLLKAVPVTGTFVSFQAEAYRTAWNTVALAADELKSDNKKVRAIGAKRLAGIAASQAAKLGLMALMGTIVSGGGDDDDDDLKKNTKLFIAPWSKDSDIVLVDYGKGKMSYIDFSASDPHGGIKKAYNSVMSGKSVAESFANGLTQLLEPFMKEDMLLNVITDIKDNKNSYGGKLYNESDTDVNKINAIMERVYKAFEPGTITSVRKVVGSDDVRNELMGQLTGYKINTVDVNKQLGFKMNELKDLSGEAKKLYSSAFYKFEDGIITGDELDKIYNQANESQKEVYKKMIDYMNAASFFGVEDYLIEDNMQGVGKSVINDLWYGDTPDMKMKESEE